MQVTEAFLDGPAAAWAVTIGIMVLGLAAATCGLLYASWKTWRHEAAWWRWPALVGLLLAALGGAVSLGQIAAVAF